MLIPQHMMDLRFIPLTGHDNNFSRTNVGWYLVLNKNVESQPPSISYLLLLPLFNISFTFTAEVAQLEEVVLVEAPSGAQGGFPGTLSQAMLSLARCPQAAFIALVSPGA